MSLNVTGLLLQDLPNPSAIIVMEQEPKPMVPSSDAFTERKTLKSTFTGEELR